MYEYISGKKVAFITLGCKVNSYETDALHDLLAKNGCVFVDSEECADIFIVNTCSVTNMADRKSRQMLHRARQKNPRAIIVATGCYAQIGGEKLIEAGDADIVVGNDHKTEIPERIDAYYGMLRGSWQTGRCMVDDIAATRTYEDMQISGCSERTRAFIKIEDGCNQFCSYCIIPYARGRVRSRSEESIVAEVKALVAAGFHEVVLTGIHLSSYGRANYEQKTGKLFDHGPLLSVIRAVAAVDGIERIRLGSLEPRIICDEFAEALAGIPKFCPQFHLSLQSGCDATLKRMNRHYTGEEYMEICEILLRHFDRPAITTDVIVGFPQESDEEFEQSAEFLARIAFARMHIFKYSRRKGTVADKMPGQLSEDIKHVRSERLLTLDRELRRGYMQSFVGEEQSVLFETVQRIGGRYYLTGLTTRYMQVAVPVESADVHVPEHVVMTRITGLLDDEYMIAERTDD